MGFDREKFLKANTRFKDERKNFENLSDGVYNFELDDVDDGVSATSGKERILFTWKVMPGDADSGRKFFQTFRHDENGYFSLQITLSQLGVKDAEEVLLNDEERKRIFLKIVGSQVRGKVITTEKDGQEFKNIRINRCFLSKVDTIQPTKAEQPPFEPNKTPQVQTPQVPVNTMALENEKIYQTGCEVVCKLSDQSQRLGVIQLYNPNLNSCFVVFKESGIQPQMVPVPNILSVTKPGEKHAGSPDFKPGPISVPNVTTVEEVEEVIEEIKLQVGMNVKFKYKEADMGAGEIHLLVPEQNAVKVKQAGKLYTVPVSNVTIVT